MNTEASVLGGISDDFLARTVEQVVAPYRAEAEALRESLADVRATINFEDRGWALIAGLTAGERLEGLDLDELQDISEAIRPHVVADALAKHAVDLYSGYVWAKGMSIDGVIRKEGTRGTPTDAQRFYQNPVNQATLFAPTAHEELQKGRFADGNILLACDTSDKTVRRIPINQIRELKVNPEFPEEIWAYLREWDPQDKADSKVIKRWYYTSRYSGRKQKTFTVKGDTIPIDETTIIVDRGFNRQIGYPLGIPDAVAAMPWIAAYEEIMQYGRVVNESLAKLLFKVISKTPGGAKQAAVKIGGMGGHANTASMVEGQDVAAFQTAGKGYEFVNARPVGAMGAAALNLPAMEFLSDSSAAGSSYGAAQALTPATKNAMRLMQSAWIEIYQDVFRVLGIKVDRIWFEPLDDEDTYRAMQALTLGAVALSDEEYRGKVLDNLNIAGDPSQIPDILKFRTQAADPAAQQAAPDQGQSNGSGGGGQGANDQRSDGIGETLRRMQDESFLDRLEELVHRLELAKES